jgi:D-glycero-D-manno-heptose 1,7-bisphosphate phosphatase
MIGPMHCKPHLFLDRDGTVIREENYLRDPDKVVLECGATEGLRRFLEEGYQLVIVSNQSGIGRGLMTEEDVVAVNHRVASLLSVEAITVSSWHHCPHHPNANCHCRKPGTAMFKAADVLSPVDWGQSIMVGDKPSDIAAGLELGMSVGLVTTGHGHMYLEWAKQRHVPVANSLYELSIYFLGPSAAPD